MEVGVRGLPSPFIKIYERGRETPHPDLRPLRPRYAGLLQAGDDSCLDGLEFGVADEFGVEHFARLT